MEPIYQRMPVILNPQVYDMWLDPAVQGPTILTPLQSPYSSEKIEVYPVNTLVNNPQNDLPECVVPLPWIKVDSVFQSNFIA